LADSVVEVFGFGLLSVLIVVKGAAGTASGSGRAATPGTSATARPIMVEAKNEARILSLISKARKKSRSVERCWDRRKMTYCTQ
jgi:hypothetical protein